VSTKRALSLMEYQKFTRLGEYLIKEVGPRFRKFGKIQPVDLFLIFIWKANRAKTKMRDKLKSNPKAKGSFRRATYQIAAGLRNANDSRDRLAILMRDWKFNLPMASAVLTVLYPNEFTIYDTLVCKELRVVYRPGRRFSEKCWADYQYYKELVCKNTPRKLRLREKDRYLRGKSIREKAERDARR
jgi:hypothetical protein